MYPSEYLSRYPFFEELLRETPPASLHDVLTGLVARPYILRFIQALIEARTPFTLAIVDLDNFKNINDNYGHRTGDELLRAIAGKLCEQVGETGVVGRYGGDEFLIVWFGGTDYDGIHRFFDRMYDDGGLFRRNIAVRGRTVFSSATVGCAVYPKDADSFEGLFALADKTLYRGKSKGRNCFIIYVPEKHAHLEIPTLARRSLYDSFYRMAQGFDTGEGAREKLRLAFQVVRENLRMERLYFLDENRRLLDAEGGVTEGVEPPDGLLHEGLYATHSLEELERSAPALSGALSGRGYESVLLSEVARPGRRFGLLVFCPEAHTFHLWQENECAAAFFLSRMLAQYLESESARNTD